MVNNVAVICVNRRFIYGLPNFQEGLISNEVVENAEDINDIIDGEGRKCNDDVKKAEKTEVDTELFNILRLTMTTLESFGEKLMVSLGTGPAKTTARKYSPCTLL